jgi:hypothetical protein
VRFRVDGLVHELARMRTISGQTLTHRTCSLTYLRSMRPLNLWFACDERADDAEEGSSCCIHLRVRAGDYVCCWCGNLFEGDDPPTGRHGRYLPRRKKR